jgi:hypothetical protein
MARMTIDDTSLTVRLTPAEKFWGFHGNLRVPLTAITSVAADPDPWPALRGRRMAGFSFTGHHALGTRLHDGRTFDFCMLHRDRPAVRVDLASGRFSRLVISVPPGGDAAAEAARIAAAAGIALSAPAS